jgi:O-antigen/teichoic acid export membrane protein
MEDNKKNNVNQNIKQNVKPNVIRNMNQDEIFYKFIILATIISIFSLVPVLYKVIQQKITSNIPYVSLILICIAFLIFMYISVSKGYYLHLFFYTFGLLCTSIIIYLKRKYDNTNVMLHKTITNIYNISVEEE